MKKISILILAVVLFLLSCATFVSAQVYVVDAGEVLTDEEEIQLNDKLSLLREEKKFDIVILTTTGLYPEDRMVVADDFYDEYGYGYGKSYDGALLLVNVNEDGTYEEGNSWISTCGKGIDYIDDEDIQDIGTTITPYLKNGNYAEAFNNYVSMVVEDIDEYRGFTIFVISLIALVIALLVAFIYTGKLKSDLISVAMATEANNYLVGGSLKISRQYDHFLYSHISKVEKQSSSSSSSHTSSSGRSHGGGGF